MPAEETIDRAVRVALFEHFAATGSAPRHDEVAAAAGITPTSPEPPTTASPTPTSSS